MIHCADALAPHNEDLLSLAYEEGTLSPQEQAHVDQCSTCQQRLLAYTTMNTALLAKLRRSRCPTGGELCTYCLGMVSEQDRISIASHILECPTCADEVATLRQWQTGFDPFPESSPSLARAVRRLFATLVVQQARSIPVTRGAQQSGSWPRQYQAGSLDLSLHLSRQASGDTMLLGILTSSDLAQTVDALEGLIVELYIAPGPLNAPDPDVVKPLLSTQVDDVGNFLLEPVPAGEYILIIHLPDKEVVIEDLQIEHE